MKHIILVCMAGMSTSLLVNKMKRAAAEKKLDVEIAAMSEMAFEHYDKPIDAVLLGPQIGYRFEDMNMRCEAKGIKAALIDAQVYAKMDGEKVLEQALNM